MKLSCDTFVSFVYDPHDRKQCIQPSYVLLRDVYDTIVTISFRAPILFKSTKFDFVVNKFFIKIKFFILNNQKFNKYIYKYLHIACLAKLLLRYE